MVSSSDDINLKSFHLQLFYNVKQWSTIRFIIATLFDNHNHQSYNNKFQLSFGATIFRFYLHHHHQPNPLQHQRITTNQTSRNFKFLKISIMDFMPMLAYEHLILLHVLLATMFSTLTLYPLYHVKMDESKTKTLCTVRHQHSSITVRHCDATACHQSISTNIQTTTSHFTLDSSRLATKFYTNHNL